MKPYHVTTKSHETSKYLCKREGEGKGEKGFTLVEILISLAIMSIITVAVYQLYISQYKTWISQDLSTEMQQNSRVSLDTMTRDLVMAGYGVTEAIQGAGTDKIAMLYKDDSSDEFVRIMFWRGTDNILYRYEESDPDVATWTIPVSWTVSGTAMIENVTELNFLYYDSGGTAFVPDDTTLSNIYRIEIKVKVRSSKKDPVTNDWKYFVMRTDVRPRNIGIEGASADSDDPAVPTNVEVVDPGICETLWVRWTPNTTDVDLAGYKIYYAQAANLKTNSTYVAKASMDVAGEYVQLTGLDPNVAYYISVTAYDSSGNESDNTAEEFGNPVTNTRIFDDVTSNGHDSTINVDKPAPPTNFRGVDGASDGWVELSWTLSVDTNVTGYRIFRSTSPFTFASYPPTGTNVTQIAWGPDELGDAAYELGPTTTTFVDKGPGLTGCQVYYYAIIPVTCNTTLISWDAGDDNTRRAISTDYAVTYGDGGTDTTRTDGQAGEADDPNGSDTAPDDNVAPGSPDITGRAGWRRVAITVENPTDSDFAMTCLYVEKAGAEGDPTLDSTKDSNGCFNVVGALAGTKSLIPDASPDSNPNGIFTNATLKSFWHDSMTVRTAAAPDLAQAGAEVQTYAYKAVSYDRCGNPATPADALSATTVKTTNLCGEDPVGKPDAPALPAVSASACTDPVPLSQSATIFWTPIPSDVDQLSTASNPWDLAGYRIFRNNSDDFSSSTLLNPDAPLWCEGTCDYPDNTVVEGETYYYKVASTDCPYEKENPSATTIRNDMTSDVIHSTATIGPIMPGQIGRDEKCSGAGSCVKDTHREVLTGVSVAADNTASPTTSSSATEFRHNTVTLFFENTSAGSMTIQRATAQWLSSVAKLTGVYIGGGRSGLPVTTTTGLSAVSGTDNDITDATITGLNRYVPIIFEFKDASDNPVDMRDEELMVTLSVKNESTGETTCLSYLTTTSPQILGSIVVPFGPSATAVSQNLPSNPTSGYAVPGVSGNTVPSGSNGSVVVSQDETVTVYADVSSDTTGPDGNKLPISSVTLYYKDTAKTVTTAPSNASDYTAVSMSLISGNIWGGTIPAKNGLRVWYYIVAKDSDENYDREPEISEGAFTYDQKTFDVCTVTPEKPTGLTASASGLIVTLNWTAPTNYTSATGGGAINESVDPIKYEITRNGTPFATLVTGTTFIDNTIVTAGVFKYSVKAINSCYDTTPACVSSSPSCRSDVSDTYGLCAGTSGYATVTVSPSSIYQGDPITATVVDCLALTGGYATTLETVNVSGSFIGFMVKSTADNYAPAVPESGVDTGTFPSTITTGASGAVANLDVAATDTIGIYYGYAGCPSSGTTPCATVSVIPRPVDPCTNTPNAPAGAVSNVLAGGNLTVTWTAVSQNTDSSAIADLAGYEVWEKVCKATKTNCSGANIVKDWFLRGTTASGTTSNIYSPDQGAANKIYYFKVRAYDTCSTPITGAFSATSDGLAVP